MGRIAPRHHRTELVILLRQFSTPITLILIAATILSAALGELVDAGIIMTIVLLSGFLSFWQESAASRAMDELLKTVEVTVEVRRGGETVHVQAHEVVTGDLVLLDTGDLIPGDCRIIEADNLLVDEAPLTGESFPNEKVPGIAAANAQVSDRSNSLFMGTHVVRGRARAVVVHVGGESEFGKTMERLEQRVPPTSFEKGISSFGALLLRVMLVLVTIILVINVALSRPLIDSLLFSLALAVGLTPQLLPAIVSISLSLGARQMARVNVIVKRLSSIEDLGGMNVLCTDKTGTITTGEVNLNSALDCEGNPSDLVMEYAYLNAFYHTGYANPIDDAILAAAAGHVTSAERIAELPYDFMRKRLSVLVKKEGRQLLVMKGAFENVLATCSTAREPGGITTPLETKKTSIRRRFAGLSQSGYRVLGVAYKSRDVSSALSSADETSMTFAGFIALEDPPKPGITETLRDLTALGISLRMITGDNRLAAGLIAETVGLENPSLMTGEELQMISDEALPVAVGKIGVFAEVDPVQKERIVRAFRHGGLVVGYLGDGINDAPALHAADVSISVDTAVDVAKDSASIVLLRKDLGVLMQGVRLGRQTFANTLKYVFVTTSANFGNMASMAGAALLLPYLPMLPLQILLLNFLSDLPATTISSDAVDPELVEKPEAWNIHSIRDFMIVFGLISSVFDFMTFGVLKLGFDASEELFRSGWFLESLGTELAVMLILRTRRPFFRSRPGILLLGTSVATAVASFILVMTPLGDPLGFVRLSPWVLLSLLGILTGYVAATEVGKRWFYGKLGH
jgi:Mg2+-importing ATPase